MAINNNAELGFENIFFVPAAARWSVIVNSAHTPEIGKQ